MRGSVALPAVAAFAALVARGTPALAQDTAEAAGGPAITGPPDAPGVSQAAERPYWSNGKHRPFASATVDLGFWYMRPTIALGYGKPHWRWLGIEAQTRLAADGGSEYVGARFALPRSDLRFGARYVFATSQKFLFPDDSYDGDELDIERGEQSRYLTLEGEMSGAISVSFLRLFGVMGGMYMTGVPDPYNVFEQNLHVVVDPPWLWRARGGALVPVGEWKAVSIGAATELLGVPERDLFVVRAGPVAAISLTHHLEAQATLMLVAYSRDQIGLDGAEFGQLGVRYRWATGDPFPELP